MQHQAAGSPPTFDSSTALIAATSAQNSDGTFSAEEVMNPQGLWCEVCEIGCNSLDTLGTHKLGKKHKRNLLRLEYVTAHAPALAPSPAPDHAPVSDHFSAVPNKQFGSPYQNPNSPSFNSSAADYETSGYALGNMYVQAVSEGMAVSGYYQDPNKQNLPNPIVSGVVKNDSKQVVAVQGNPVSFRNNPQKRELIRVYVCDVCEIDCSSKELLDLHHIGKKHKKNVEKQKPAQEDPILLGNNPEKSKLQKSYFCDVCKIKCTSSGDLLDFHNNGKKHKKNVVKQKAAISLACVRPPTPAHAKEN